MGTELLGSKVAPLSELSFDDDHISECQEMPWCVVRVTGALFQRLQPCWQSLLTQHHPDREHNGDAGGMDNAGGEDSKDDDNDSDTPMARWNLRRASAAGLDRLSLTYHDELLPVLLPIVQQRLQVSSRLVRLSWCAFSLG